MCNGQTGRTKAAKAGGRQGRAIAWRGRGRQVGRRLKEMFDEVTTQPIPDKFVKLLEELQHAQPGEPPSDQTESAPSKPKPKRKPRKSK